MEPPYYFVMYRDRANEWRWYLWSHNNGRKLADSGEGFTTRQSCERNIALVKQVVPGAPVRYLVQQ